MEETIQTKKTVFSAIQPSGKMTLGNYLGAVKNWALLQDEYECIYSIADLHAVTIDIEPAVLRGNTLEMAAQLLAFGIDPERSTLFVQSQVPAHAELTWILNCHTYLGEAKRMTQFKDKSKRHPENVNVGLFDYPILQAADILLYQAHFVPVGKDQKQHLELSRDLALRFNNKYSPTFVVPEVLTPKAGGKVMSLSEPAAKMSKSDPNENAYILLLDEPAAVMRKFKRAVTDSGSSITAAPDKPGVTNLLTIYSAISGKTVAAAEKEFAGLQGYGEFKAAVADAVIEFLRPRQLEYKKLMNDKAYLTEILSRGREKAAYAARKTLSKVYRKMGFLQ